MFGFLSLRKTQDAYPTKDIMAVIGEDNADGGIDWYPANYEYCVMQLNAGVLENRGYMMVNDIMVWRFYLPPPPHNHITTP